LTNWNPRITKAVLLAAGRGTRLGALTSERPKPMIPVRGAPVLEHILLGLKSAGASEALIVVGYRAEAIRDHFRDGSHLGVSIHYAHQEIPNGTGTAYALGRDFVNGEPFFASFGDILTDYSHYRALLAEFSAAPCAAVLGINWMDDPSAGGAVYREGSRVIRVVEKPPSGTAGSNWNLAGVNVFGPEVFSALDRIEPSPRGEKEITSGYEILLREGQEIRACELHGFWSDVGTPESLAFAEANWAIGELRP
jgi:UDP-N-acetylglucosamine diphosphorylase / glucose-1-phosphate thymidylyltransferase / UDP-N-acetylgalactosamine diphosphorylase / glucosamine-1-phosphate N-acetyltransferase / galactosamine-1-phosphate N-acetyltransferase